MNETYRMLIIGTIFALFMTIMRAQAAHQETIIVKPGPQYCQTRCSALTNTCTTSCL